MTRLNAVYTPYNLWYATCKSSSAKIKKEDILMIDQTHQNLKNVIILCNFYLFGATEFWLFVE